MFDISKKAKEGLIKYGLGFLLLGTFYNFIIHAALGAVGAAFLGLFGVFMVNWFPLISRAIVTGRIKAALWWVRMNPIEDMIERQETYSARYKKLLDHRIEYGTSLSSLSRRCDDFYSKFPTADSTMRDSLAAYVDVYRKIGITLEKIRLDLEAGANKIEQATALYEMGQLGQKMGKILRLFNEADPGDKLRERVAIEAVWSSIDQGLLQLEAGVKNGDFDMTTAPAASPKTQPEVLENAPTSGSASGLPWGQITTETPNRVNARKSNF